MNWTFKLLAVALTALASLSLDLNAQSTLDPQSTLDSMLNKAREKMKLASLECAGACGGRNWLKSRGSVEPYADAEAYQVYSALIPYFNPNPEKTWFIRIDTVPTDGSLDDQSRKLWKQTRGADTALDDYFKVNRKIWLLQRKFTLPNPYRLVTREEIKAFPPRLKRGDFTELNLSAVGFNADKTLAVVYMMYFCNKESDCGEGSSYVLQKQNGKWKVSSLWECWMS